MGRAPCCSKVGLHRGPWTPREDTLLTEYIKSHGEGHWRSLPEKAGLLRCGKSCRLRWMNYLRPDIKRGNITPDEEELIIRMHSLLGNRWSLIANRLSGRTDNEIKNYWNTHLSKKLLSQGIDPVMHKKLSDVEKQNRVIKGRKRSNSTNNSKNNKLQDNKSSLNVSLVEAEKHKVHLPKPVRVSPNKLCLPRNDSLVSFDSTFSSTTQGGEPTCLGRVEPCPNNTSNNNNNNNGVRVHVGDGSTSDDRDLECESTDNINSLDNLYEQYLNLLKTDGGDDLAHDQVQLDSFAESLLL